MKLQQLSLSDLYGLQKSMLIRKERLLTGRSEESRIRIIKQDKYLNLEDTHTKVCIEIGDREDAIIQEVTEASEKDELLMEFRSWYEVVEEKIKKNSFKKPFDSEPNCTVGQIRKYLLCVSKNVEDILNHVLSMTKEEREEAPIKEEIPTIVRKGYGQAVKGLTLLVTTQSDEMVRVDFKDREEQWKYYCKYLKVTIEVIDESEIEED